MADKKRFGEEDNVLPDVDSEKSIIPELYNEIAKSATLLGIQLIESHFNVIPAFFETDKDETKFGLDVSHIHQSIDHDKRVVSCIFQYECNRRKGNRKLLTLKDKFLVFYYVPGECDDFHALAFSKRTGVMACYPYFRSHFAESASLASAEMPILPTLAKMPIK